MVEIIRNCITIAADADRVFSFIADPNTAPLRMPAHSYDRYGASGQLAKGDTRETTYSYLGIQWTEHRWVIHIDEEQQKVVWHTDSRFNLREEWRVEALDAGRCRLVLERQLAPMNLAERLLWRVFTSYATSRVMDERLKMTRQAIEGGWEPGGRLSIA